MKERTTYHCDRCDKAAQKTAFSTVAYGGRNIDLCPGCAREFDSWIKPPEHETPRRVDPRPLGADHDL